MSFSYPDCDFSNFDKYLFYVKNIFYWYFSKFGSYSSHYHILKIISGLQFLISAAVSKNHVRRKEVVTYRQSSYSEIEDRTH